MTGGIAEHTFEALQSLLEGLEAWDASQAREFERDGRRIEMDWRKVERERYVNERLWVEAEIAQRTVENARYLWDRYVAHVRTIIDEKTNILSGIAHVGAFLGIFSVTSMVNLAIPPNAYMWVKGLFVTSVALTVSLMTASVVTCTLISACMQRVGRHFVSPNMEAKFMEKCFLFVQHYKKGDAPPPLQSPIHIVWTSRFESDWHFALWCFTLGVPCSFAMLGFSCVMSFSQNNVGWVCLAYLVVVLDFLWFLLQFKYLDLLLKSKTYKPPLEQQPRGLPWDWHLLSDALHRNKPDGVPNADSANSDNAIGTTATANVATGTNQGGHASMQSGVGGVGRLQRAQAATGMGVGSATAGVGGVWDVGAWVAWATGATRGGAPSTAMGPGPSSDLPPPAPPRGHGSNPAGAPFPEGGYDPPPDSNLFQDDEPPFHIPAALEWRFVDRAGARSRWHLPTDLLLHGMANARRGVGDAGGASGVGGAGGVSGLAGEGKGEEG